VSPHRVFAPTWTWDVNYQEYSSPETLPTSEPASANYTWTVDSGDFVQCNSDSGAWVRSAQSVGHLRVFPVMVFWGKSDSGSDSTMAVKSYHKYGGGVTDLYYSPSVNSSNLIAGRYFALSVRYSSSLSPYPDVVVDDLVGVKIWAVETDIKIYHRAMYLSFTTWYPGGKSAGLIDTFVKWILVPVSSGPRSFYGLSSSWGNSGSTMSSGDWYQAEATLAGGQVVVSTSTGVSMPVFVPARGSTLIYGINSAGASNTTSMSLVTNQNASQASVLHPLNPTPWTICGSRFRAQTKSL